MLGRASTVAHVAKSNIASATGASTTKLGDLVAFNNHHWSGETAQESIHDISHAVEALVETIERKNKSRLNAVAQLREGLEGEHGLNDAVAARVGSLLDLFEAEARLAEKLSSMNISGMRGFPHEELWQLFIDRNLPDAERDIFVFENERGYMAGMMNGFRAMLDTFDEPLYAAGYRELHDTCVDNVFSEPSDNRPEQRMDKGFREGGYMVSFGVVFSEKADPDHTFTKAGCEELLGKSDEELALVNLQGDEQHTDVPTLDWTQIAGRSLYGTNEVNEHTPWNLLGVNGKDQVTSFMCAPRSQDDCAERARQILDAYYNEISATKDDDGRLLAIVRCCRDLDQSHLFSDGNIRTIAFVLLNKLLLENGMRPAIMVEPNAFDGYALRELVTEIENGQDYVARLCGDQDRLSPEEAQALSTGKV